MRKITRLAALAAAGLTTTLAFAPVAASASTAPSAATARSLCTTNSGPTACPAWAGWIGRPKAHDSMREAQVSFTIPTVKCADKVGPRTASQAAFWVGFDGATGNSPVRGLDGHNTLEQTGVIAACQSTTARPRYYAFWEMWQRAYGKQPAFSIQTFGKQETYSHAGDEVTSWVTYDKATKTYKFGYDDSTSGQKYSTKAKCAKWSLHAKLIARCDNASAEIITEATSGGPDDGYSVPEMGTVHYGDTEIGVASQTHYGLPFGALRLTNVTMSPKGHAGLITAGRLASGGDGFSTYWNKKAAG